MHVASERRRWFLSIGIALMMLSPILVLLLPRTVANVVHHSSSNMVLYVNTATYIWYAVAFLLLVGSSFLVYFFWEWKFVLLLGCLPLLLSVVLFVFVSRHYIAIGYDEISYQHLFSTKEHHYRWDEIEEASYEQISASDNRWQYQFTFNDGETLVVAENGYIAEIQAWMSDQFKKANVELVIIK